METIKLTSLQRLHVLFPEEIEDLKEDYGIMSSRLTLEQMMCIRDIFKNAKGVINVIMGMNSDEFVSIRKQIGDIIISTGMDRIKLKENLNEYRNGILKN